MCPNVCAHELIIKHVVFVGDVGGWAAFPEQSFLGRCWMKMVTENSNKVKIRKKRKPDKIITASLNKN